MLTHLRFLAFFTLLSAGQAQWLNFPAPGIPRTRNGKPNLAARPPRLSNGKPDLSGVWHVEPTPMVEMKRLFGADIDLLDLPGMEADTVSKYAADLLLDFKPEDSLLRPEAAAILRARRPGDNPSDHCLPMGIPFASLVSEPVKFVQTPSLLVILFESVDGHRQIYTDGRPLPKDPDPAWLGYSVGRWEADTLVIKTIGFNNKTWLDDIGHPHSEALRLTERFRRPDFGHLDVRMTFDDPIMYTRPFTVTVGFQLWPDSDILESFCNENEKDVAHGRK